MRIEKNKNTYGYSLNKYSLYFESQFRSLGSLWYNRFYQSDLTVTTLPWPWVSKLLWTLTPLEVITLGIISLGIHALVNCFLKESSPASISWSPCFWVPFISLRISLKNLQFAKSFCIMIFSAKNVRPKMTDRKMTDLKWPNESNKSSNKPLMKNVKTYWWFCIIIRAKLAHWTI